MFVCLHYWFFLGNGCRMGCWIGRIEVSCWRW
jgi:hypothetical protein